MYYPDDPRWIAATVGEAGTQIDTAMHNHGDHDMRWPLLSSATLGVDRGACEIKDYSIELLNHGYQLKL